MLVMQRANISVIAIIFLRKTKITRNTDKFINVRKFLQVKEMAGMVYNPLAGEWSLSDDTSVNYIAYGVKRKP